VSCWPWARAPARSPPTPRGPPPEPRTQGRRVPSNPAAACASGFECFGLEFSGSVAPLRFHCARQLVPCSSASVFPPRSRIDLPGFTLPREARNRTSSTPVPHRGKDASDHVGRSLIDGSFDLRRLASARGDRAR
jgi:hypothetical protein